MVSKLATVLKDISLLIIGQKVNESFMADNELLNIEILDVIVSFSLI